MPKRFLNVEYNGVKAEIDVTDAERLGQVQLAIKEMYGEDISAPPYRIQLFQPLNNQDKQISDLDEITDDFFMKLTKGGRSLVIHTAPSPNQPDEESKTSKELIKNVTAFWNAFSNHSGAIEANSVIHLPSSVFILGEANLGSSLFIRPCYPKLLEIALSILQCDDTRHLIILGNPGIGKTYFGYFLLLHLARSGATVVYERGATKTRILFTPNGISIGEKNAFRNILYSSQTFYIVDARKPIDVNARTILLSSLRREIWHEFSKGACTIRYMPVWTRDEILSCRSVLYPTISEELVLALYSKWGGIARYVLSRATEDAQQSLLEHALDRSNVNSVLESIGRSDEKGEVSSRLIHLSVTDDFQSGPYLFASTYVADEMYTRAYGNNRNLLIRFLSASEGIGDTGQLRGVLFERHAHEILSKGGQFRTRNLQNGQETQLHLPNNLTTFLYSMNNPDFQAATNCYFHPRSKSFESVDSFIKPNLLFQMTIAKDHPCKQSGLQSALEILGYPSDPVLYFVVPPDRFETFQYQNYCGKDGKVLSQNFVYNTVKKISQYVLTFDLYSQ
ncbi:hypothetical protein HDV04_002613 [Boothiomyces sp. JEL0838]|nr:hypothetical protein HDV04_002613 [Boothiomyces sp. JEL0838]